MHHLIIQWRINIIEKHVCSLSYFSFFKSQRALEVVSYVEIYCKLIPD